MTDQRTIPNDLLDILGEESLSKLILAWLAIRDPSTIRQLARRSPQQPPTPLRTSIAKSKGLNAIRAAAIQAPTAIHVLNLNDTPRTTLTTGEVAKITGMTTDRVLKEINRGRIRVITGGKGYAIPVTELIEINKWADYLDP